MGKTKEEKKAEKTDKTKAAKIILDNLKELNKEKPDLESIWKAVSKTNAKLFETEINKLKKYFQELNTDGRYGGSVFDDLKGISKKLKVKRDSDIAKLMTAMAWKNGDKDKEFIILKGIKEAENEKVNKDNQKVFYQFGKFLGTLPKDNSADFSKVEPIMDQHTMRAFVFLQNGEYAEIKDTIPSSITKDYWNDYRDWYKETVKNCGGSEQAFWLLNHIMFVLGKAIKN